MASGNTLAYWMAEDGMPPTTAAASLDRRLGGSTSAEQFLVVDFDGGSADESYDFRGIMPQNYAAGGVTLRLWWGATTATTGDVRLGLAFRAIEDDAEDIDAAHTYDFNEVTDTVPNLSGEYTAAVITFTDGVDMDSVGAGDPFILRIRREASDTILDTMAGDMELLAIEMRET